MAGGSIGEVAAEMRVDSKEAISALKQYESAAQIGDRSIRQLEQDNQRLGTSFLKTGAQAGQARNALIGINYIIQDMPYGLRGIANNLDMTVQQMGMLISTSGGIGAAMKNLGATLVGPAGLMMGFSAIISILQMVQDRFRETKDVAENAADGIVKSFAAMVGTQSEDIKKSISRGLHLDLDDITKQYESVKDRIEATKSLANTDTRGGLVNADLERQIAAAKQLRLALENELQLLGVKKKDQQDLVDAVDTELRKQEAIARAIQKANDAMGEVTLSPIQQVNKDIKDLQDAIDQAPEANLPMLNDMLEEAKKRKEGLLKSSKDIEEDNKKSAENAKRDREAADKEVFAKWQELESERQEIEARHLKEYDRQQKESVDTVTKYLELKRQAELDAIASPYERAQREEDDLHEKKLKNYRELEAVGLDVDEMRRNEEIRHTNAIGNIRKKQQEDVHRQEMDDLNQFIDGVDKLGNAIHRAFKDGGDELIQSLLAALQIAAQIKKNMSGGSDGSSPLDLIGMASDVMSLAALFAKTAPVAQRPVEVMAPEAQNPTSAQTSTPTTPAKASPAQSVPAETPASPVEQIKPKEPAVEPVAAQKTPDVLVSKPVQQIETRILKPEMEGLRSLFEVLERSLRVGPRTSPYAPDAPAVQAGRYMQPSEGNVAPAGSIAENIRFREVPQGPPSVTVVLEGTLEGQQFLKKQFPKYDRFRKQKST